MADIFFIAIPVTDNTYIVAIVLGSIFCTMCLSLFTLFYVMKKLKKENSIKQAAEENTQIKFNHETKKNIEEKIKLESNSEDTVLESSVN